MSDTLTAEIKAFREDLMLDFLSEMIAYARAKGARNAITLLPVEEQARESLPWDRVADIPGLDIFGTDPYWVLHGKDCEEYVSSQVQRTVDICQPRGLTSHVWVQGFGIPSGREAELETGACLAVQKGAQSVAVWGMHGNAAYDGASEDPELVWETVGRTFQKLRT